MKKHRNRQPAPPAPAGSLVYLRLDQLKTHPENMRRFYPMVEARAMAKSIRATKGVIHPLVVVPDGAAGSYYVVDGNMRLTGARLLGDDCPPLKAEIVSVDRAGQYLTMAAANGVRFDVDPISEGLHFKRLLDEGLTRLEIAERSGVNLSRITFRLRLLQLDDEIQQLIAEGKFPVSDKVADALMLIPEPEARVKLARRLSEQGATNNAIVAACAKLAAQFGDPKSRVNRRRGRPPRRAVPSAPQPPALPGLAPALAYAQDKTGHGLPAGSARAEWPAVRAAARAMCDGCDIKTETLRGRVPEPAWTLITHAAEETCGGCNVRDVHGACQGCPGVELITRLIRGAHAQPLTIAETAPERRY